MRSIVAALGLSLCASLTDAQTMLSGRVVEQSSTRPLACIAVQLLDGSGSVRDSAMTWTGGIFEFALPADSFRLRFVSPGLTDVHTALEATLPGPLMTREYRIPIYPDSSVFYVEPRPPSDTALLRALPNSPNPPYPENLRQRGIQGAVYYSYVIDTLGRVDSASAIPLRTTHRDFLRSVQRTLPRLRYVPWSSPLVGHCARVFQPFLFHLTP